MPAKHSRHIALTAPLATWIDEQVASGQYASASDVVRAAVRLLQVKADVPPLVTPQDIAVVSTIEVASPDEPTVLPQA